MRSALVGRADGPGAVRSPTRVFAAARSAYSRTAGHHDGLRPLVSAKINGAEALFIADSGAFYSLITPAAAAQFKLKLGPAPYWLC